MADAKAAADRAEELFCKGYNCCESASLALTEALGMKCDCLPGLATGLGGGMGHTGHMCGAITGSAMVIGLAAMQRKLRDHTAEKTWANEVVADLIGTFERQFGNVACRDLINVDFQQPGWLEEYKSRGLKKDCTDYLRFAVEWTLNRLTSD